MSGLGIIYELRKMSDGQATYSDAREVMLQAADTIWQLLSDLQYATAENAKLRASNEVIAEDHAARCELNVKLREFVRELHNAYVAMVNEYEIAETQLIWERRSNGAKSENRLRNECEDMRHHFDRELRELGIEI